MAVQVREAENSSISVETKAQVIAIAYNSRNLDSFPLLGWLKTSHFNQYRTLRNLRYCTQAGVAILIPTLQPVNQYIAILFHDGKTQAAERAIASLLGEVERLQLTSVEFASDESFDWEAVVKNFKYKTKSLTATNSQASFQKVYWCDFSFKSY